jgi:ankyrin repeat protein
MKLKLLLLLLSLLIVDCSLYCQTPVSIISDKSKTEDQKIKDLKILLDKGTSVDTRSADIPKLTPLMRAADLGNKKVFEFLLGYAPDINAMDDNGSSALFYAARKGHLEIVRLLLINGAEVKKVTKDGNTILLDIFRKYGANLEEAQKESRTEQFKKNILTIVDLLAKAGADINAKSREKKTPIMWAALYNVWPAVDLLKSNDADLTGLEQHLPVDQKNKPLTPQEKQYFEKLRKDIKNYAIEEGWHRL